MKNLLFALTAISTALLLAVCVIQKNELDKRGMEISDLQRTLIVKQAYINNLKK